MLSVFTDFRFHWTARVSGGVLLLILVLVAVGCSGSRGPANSSPDPEDGRPGDAPKVEADPSAPSVPTAPRPVAAPTQPPSADEYAGVGIHRPVVAQDIVARTNRARKARGRASLRQDSTLARIACWHNQDMLVHDYMGHKDAGRQLPSDRLAREHRRLIGTVGENVYEGEVGRQGPREWGRSAMEDWLKSPGHRANILRQSFTHLGVCATGQESVLKATQLFTAVWAYFETPLPWTLSAGDSLSVAVRPVKAAGPPAQYAFVPVGESLDQAFDEEDRGRAYEGTLIVPMETGQYGTRFLFPVGKKGRYTILSGPRVTVE